MSSLAPSTPTHRVERSFDVALFVGSLAAAAMLISKGINDIRGSDGWPGWLELVYVVSVMAVVSALVLAGWSKWKLARLTAATEDERTRATHTHATAAALGGALTVQLPFFFRVDVPSVAQAQFTVAAAVLTYGAIRLWLSRDA